VFEFMARQLKDALGTNHILIVSMRA
jgi:hypothetical protein